MTTGVSGSTGAMGPTGCTGGTGTAFVFPTGPTGTSNYVITGVFPSVIQKAAVGRTITFQGFVSDDNGATWTFAAGSTWQSYGATGYSAAPYGGGAAVHNPDPSLSFPIASGQRVKLVVTPSVLETLAPSFRSS